MPVLPRTPDGVARIAFTGSLHGEPWANVFHVKFTAFSAATAAQLKTFLDAMAGDYNSTLMQHMGVDATFTNGKAQLFLAAPDVLVVESTYTYAGAVTDDAESNSACYVLSWLISASYRGGKPRTYLPGVNEHGTSDHRSVTPATALALTNDAIAWKAAIAALGVSDLSSPVLGCVSFRTGNAPRGTALFRPFTGVTVHPRLGTQRRRYGRWHA